MRYAALLLCLVAAPLAAQQNGPAILIQERARLAIDSIAATAAHEELEPGACVTSWTFVGDTITIHAIGPADLVGRQKGSVQWRNGLCGDSLPSLHGHLVQLGHWLRPTPVDWVLATDTVRKRAPFHLVLVVDMGGVASHLVAYGVKRP